MRKAHNYSRDSYGKEETKAQKITDQRAIHLRYLLSKYNRQHLIKELTDKLEREERYKWYFDKRL
jgi:hypothetical protein